MVLLGLSFVVWGIADVFRNIGSSGAAAEVGSAKFSQEDFRRAYSERMQQLGRQIGRGITPDQARALGLDRQVLSEMLSEAALDQKVKSLGLNMSDEALARVIEKSPEFSGPNGFSHEYFLLVLRSNGTTETQYVATQRRELLRRELGQALVGYVAAPKVMADALRRYQSEERAIEFVTLKPGDVGALPTPTPEQLKAYYEDNKALFRAPEYRKLQLLVLTPEAVAATIEMPEAELRKIYESQKDRFGTPEKREVEQMVFDKPEDAAAAAAKLSSGASFDTLATERKLSAKDISLGTVTRREILDPAVAEAAFSLPVNQVSAPVTGRFGTILLRVKKIEPSNQQPFEAVADTIKKEALAERARRVMLDLHDKIEDERAGGASVPETAAKLKLKFETVDAVDRSGRKPDGGKIEGIAGSPDVLDPAFKAPVGTDNDTLELRGQRGYVWYDVVSTAPSRERAFDEVKQQVETRYGVRDVVVSRLGADYLDWRRAAVRLNALAAGPGETLLGFGPIAGKLNLSAAGDLVEAAANLFVMLHALDTPDTPRIAVAPIRSASTSNFTQRSTCRVRNPRIQAISQPTSTRLSMASRCGRKTCTPLRKSCQAVPSTSAID